MTTETSTIREDVQNGSDEGTEIDPVEAFMKRFADDQTDPSTTEQDEGADVEATETAEGVEGEGEPTEGDEPGEEHLADDEHKVVIKVGEEEHKVAVKDLKRLFGQEKSLTQKSQQATEALKRAETEGEKAVTILSALIQRADQEWEAQGYNKVDLNLAARELPKEVYLQLKRDMERAHMQRMFLRQEADNFVNLVRQNRQQAVAQAMTKLDEAMAADETTKDWTADTRKEVVTYAVSQGMPQELADTITDPAAMRLMRKAMLFDRGSRAVQAKVTPVAKTAPKTTVKPGARSGAHTDGAAKLNDAVARLRRTGSLDDAALAFSARFGG